MIRVKKFSIAIFMTALALPTTSVAQNITDKGKTSCEYGSVDCNRCAYNVREQFRSLSRNPNGRFKFLTGAGEELPALENPMLPISEVTVEGLGRNKGHVQGFSRLSGDEHNNWFVVSLDSQPKSVPDDNSDPPQPSGLLFVEMGGVASANPSASAGHRLSIDNDVDRFFPPSPDATDAARFYFPVDNEETGLNTPHPSGFQPIGKIIPIPSFGQTIFETAYVQFVLPVLKNSAGTEHKKEMTAIVIGQLSLKDIGFGPHKSSRKVYAGAAAKLQDNRNLLILLRSDFGHLQYYVSNAAPWSTAQWDEHRVDDTNFSRYQNMALITECFSGDLYLIGMKWRSDRVLSFLAGNIPVFLDPDGPWEGESKADLYKIRLKDDGRLDTSGKLETVLLDEAEDSCEAKGGSGVYVTPHGRLIVYCSQGRSVVQNKERRDWQTLRFTEFVASSDLPKCPSLVAKIPDSACEEPPSNSATPPHFENR